MYTDLAQKAREGRMSALLALPARKDLHVKTGGRGKLPKLDTSEIGALFASSQRHAQNIFSV